MKDPYYDRSEISNSDLSELKRQLYGGMGIDPVHAKFGNLIDHMITEPEKVDYFKLTCAGEQMTEGDFKKAEEMKKAFMQPMDAMTRTSSAMLSVSKRMAFVILAF